MKILKTFIPLITIIGLGMLWNIKFALLPHHLSEAMQFLPPLLMVLVSLVIIHFNQSQLLSLVIIISAFYLSLEQQWLSSTLIHNLFAACSIIVLVIVMLLKQQNIFSVKAIPIYVLFSCAAFASLWLIREQPEWLTTYLLGTWFPIGINNKSSQLLSHTNLILFAIALLILLMIFYKKPDSIISTAIGVLTLLFIGLNFSITKQQLLIMSSCGYALCLLSTLQQSWRMAYLDELTEVPARRALQQKLQSLVGLYTLVMIDIDHFKKFNDKYGHDVGDQTLKMVAQQLESSKGRGSVYRFGGEEFTMVFTNKSCEQIKDQLQKIRQQVEEMSLEITQWSHKKGIKSKHTQEISVTISLGAADSIGISSADETLKQADIALYKAKKKGRNRVEFSV